MEWFVANQKSLVFSAFVFCAWFIVQMLKQLIKKFGTDRIRNKYVQNDVRIATFVILICSTAIGFAYLYKHIYADANVAWTAVSIGVLSITSHEIIYKAFRNCVLLIFSRFKARKAIKTEEIVDTIKDTIQTEQSENEDTTNSESLVDKLKHYE